MPTGGCLCQILNSRFPNCQQAYFCHFQNKRQNLSANLFQCYRYNKQLLADRTNGRAYATVLRLSVRRL